MKVFVAGPIHGFEDKQDYRRVIAQLLRKFGYEPVDPWEREREIYQRSSKDRSWWRRAKPEEFVRRDLEDIERCDALIAY